MPKSQKNRRLQADDVALFSGIASGLRPWLYTALIVGGMLFVAALVSYDPDDVPAIFGISSSSDPNQDKQNWAGVVGAVVAGYGYFFLGAGAYFMAAVTVFAGLSPLTRIPVNWKMFVGGALLVLSAAAIASRQPWFFQHWESVYNIGDRGGVLGRLASHSLYLVFGMVGSLVILIGAYLTGLMLLTGFEPFLAARICMRNARIWNERRLDRHWQRADSSEKCAIEAKELERRARVLERDKKKAAKRLASVEKDLGDFEVLPGYEGELDAVKKRGKGKSKTAPKPRAAKVEEEPDTDEGEELGAEMEEEMADERPEPKIIDGLAPKPKPKAPVSPSRESQFPATFGNTTYENYQLPPTSLLDDHEESQHEPANKDQLYGTQRTIVETLDSFGIVVTPGDITRGPTITRYEIYPAKSVRVNRITALEADIARATKAERINIIAPIPGKDTVGVELANVNRVPVSLRELLDDEAFGNSEFHIPIALGKDVYGNVVMADLAKMPHLLVAGATGSGKSVCINSVIASLLFQFTPDQLRFIMVDPKVVELQVFENLPHLVIPVVTDPKKVILALRWVIVEMEQRYKMFAEVGVRNFDSFNKRSSGEEADEEVGDLEVPEVDPEEIEAMAADLEVEESGELWEDDEFAEEEAGPEIPEALPYIVVIIDELADLMQTSSADVELCIGRITQMARAAGIHLIVATQTPRADVITGTIKANIPTRIAFQVASALDSRVILGSKGADKLIGQGDMLYLPPGSSKLTRVQGAFITDEEMNELVDYCSEQGEPSYEPEAERTVSQGVSDQAELSDNDEETLDKCLEVIRQEKRASTSLLQRRLSLGYNRAARMMDVLEERGYIGPGEGAKPREILVDLDQETG